ncbi:DNA phosphorothioation-dependent restriction protein DptH [Sutcliffiella horikoshii]|uniref:DNA phosphorothioation-dependent restriction protein DptH n=1 Tax=Sutcliffiella horikoshii TaxID=79883 RepID=UPI00384CFF08
MSNQFYKYIASLLISYFKKEGLKNGDRYYLQLDSPKDVMNLIIALNNIDGTKGFKYQHDLGERYETFSIPFKETNLVVANTSDQVKPDFLVTLRNLVGEQKEEWENTALLSIVSEQLDSIQGGSSDLQKEGMPLHPGFIYNKLKNEIESSVLTKVEQIILLENLDNLMEEQFYQQITFFEFEDIFSTLQKGYIDDKEYYKFGLFKDPDLDRFTGREQKERITLNRELFDFVKKVHDYGLEQNELESKFVLEGSKALFEEGWEQTLYPKVKKFHDDFNANKKKAKVDFTEIKVSNKLIVWNRTLSEKGTGKRKRHFIIFNPDNKDDIEVQLSFSFSGSVKSLVKDFFKVQKGDAKNVEADVKKSNISLKLYPEDKKPLFLKFSYKHDKKINLGAEFSLSVLPIEPIYLEAFSSKYTIDAENNAVELNCEEDLLKFGNGYNKKTEEISINNQILSFVTEEETLIVSPLPEAYDDKDQLRINIKFDQVDIPFKLTNELPESMPISGQRISKLIRETGKDIQWIKENNRLVLENREFYFHSEYSEYFNWENEYIERGLKSARFESDQLLEDDLKISDEMREAYSRFITYFKIRNSIPSLCTITEDLKQRSKEYVKAFQDEVKTFTSGTPAGKRGRDLFKLGTIYSNGTFYFTPFHPLMVAYKLKTYELLKNEEVDNSILNRLSSASLVPFIYDQNETLYKPEHQNAALGWMLFRPVQNVSVSDANHYLAKVVIDKISQFKEHFSYLFIKMSNAPLQINVLNITNDKEVLKGIIEWMLIEIDKVGSENLKPIEVTLYSEEKYESIFDLYALTNSTEELELLTGVKLKSKDYEADDLLRIIRGKLLFYKQDFNEELRYAHISFYKMNAQEHHAVQPVKDMTTGLSLEGLYSSVPSMKDQENYKSGFGTKAYSINDSDYLISTSYYVNELSANLRNNGSDGYRKREAILSRTTTADEDTLKRIFQSSYWVTFVDPSIDLEFFNEYEGNLVVIHYSDQYSSSSRFDAITVTDKSDQYFAVIKEFLAQKDVQGTDENVRNTIKAFNTFNGEWLLRIIGSKGHFDREKLSIISAIKYSVSYLDHKDILWIPISLEEVLRVAGAVSLSKSEGVFTAKNLRVKGSHSDDLLLIGLEEKEGNVSLHFYPVEVKIGLNKGTVIEKAKEQVRKTRELIYSALTGENEHTFSGKFYRNFFAQLLISSAQKIRHSELWNEKGYELSDQVVEVLLKDKFNVSDELRTYIGDGAILSFQKDAFHRSAHLDDENILLVNLTERDGYEGLVSSLDSMRNWIQEQPNDFVKEDMLSYKYKNADIQIPATNNGPVTTGNPSTEYTTETESNELNENHSENNHSQPGQPATPFKDVDEPTGTDDVEEDTSPSEVVERIPEETRVLEDIRIKIGTAEASSHEVYWEYGNKGLANRHLLISGKSGQGKTYFMQCLLLEKSKLGIPSIVIDYTEGFLPNQLEPEFVEFLGDKLKQKIVYSEQLPINPFQKNVRDIGGIQLPESNTDVAERIKSVFAAVYKSLGIQQQNAIYEAVLNGLEQFNDDMNLMKLKDMLEEDGSSYSKTALSQIRPLIDRNPFSNENTINWKDVVDSNGDIFIVQLTGFPRDVQLMITEFILWDLWNYSVRFGNKNRPMPVIMDEAQNLDHTEKSPSARILTEGRKFGWSAWYATQFLKSQLDSDELARLQNSSQKVYFSPPEQELSTIAGSLSKDNQEKKHWESKLSSLRKGQCIVHGPVLKPNCELSHPTVTVVDISPLSERI